ncbi:MAG: tetratricopeptide repeat protein [Magnetococcales bacterium]|nr:tetratricopeptide repeat protein [Magnetococcales bacterium]
MHEPSDLKALLSQAIAAHEEGQLAEAERLYHLLLKEDAQQVDALHMLGVLAHQRGDLKRAERWIKKALKIRPIQPVARGNLGNILADMGALKEAIRHYRKALVCGPGLAEIHANLGAALRESGQLQEAADSCQTALQLQPDLVEAHYDLGSILLEMRKFEEARERFSSALALDPNFSQAHNNLGLALRKLQRDDDAKPHFERALSLNPELAEAHNNLGCLLRREENQRIWLALGNRPMEAPPSKPPDGPPHSMDMDAAISHFKQAIKLRPEYTEAYHNLGHAYKDLGQLDQAMACYRQTLLVDKHHFEALNSMGHLFKQQGYLKEALACYHKALGIHPDYDLAKSFICTLLYLPDVRQEALFDACHRLAKATLPHHTPPLWNPLEPNHSPNMKPLNRRLRIGYLSSDFRDHPVGQNLLPLLRHHDRSRFELFAYAEPLSEDYLTGEIRTLMDHWHSTEHQSDHAIAKQIRDDGIDIMVYLAGLFDDNRVQAAIYRPAPVQVSFHNGTTTALPAMDYWLTDSYLHPPQANRETFTEQLIRLPHFYCFAPLEETPDVGPLPALRHGYPTLASFNNPTKLNREVIALWARIMKVLPDARLRLKYRERFGVGDFQERLLGRFARYGVDPHRLEIINHESSSRDHLALYNDVDIALDPFPFTGATTTFQALWMGVPVVTWPGERFIGRMAGDIVTHAGLADLATHSPDDYVAKVVALASDLEPLQTLRQALRDRVLASPLCDGVQYAKHVEQHYLEMWDRISPAQPEEIPYSHTDIQPDANNG